MDTDAGRGQTPEVSQAHPVQEFGFHDKSDEEPLEAFKPLSSTAQIPYPWEGIVGPRAG